MCHYDEMLRWTKEFPGCLMVTTQFQPQGGTRQSLSLPALMKGSACTFPEGHGYGIWLYVMGNFKFPSNFPF